MSHSKKIVMLGHFGVGKTSLVRRYIDDAFDEKYLVTVGVHVKKKSLEINGQDIALIIWDIEGKTAVSEARSSYLLGANGFLYVFDVTRPETFENFESEVEELNTKYPEVPVIVIGNKEDLLTPVTKEYFSQTEFDNILFTSALSGENVEKAFLDLTNKMISS